MTFRERMQAIFDHRPAGNILFQPRIDHWYNVNKQNGTLPERYRKMTHLEVLSDLGCSMRSYELGLPCLKCIEDSSVKIEHETHGDTNISRWVTPVGSVETHCKMTTEAFHTAKYPIETPEDARVVEYILKGRTWEFDLELFKHNDALLGDMAPVIIFIPRVNLQKLYIELMGLENTMYALADDEAMVERLISTINETDGLMLKAVADSPIEIINFGDNIDQHFTPPGLFEKYVLPEYQRRVECLRSAGKKTFAHWDGSVKQLLKYAQATKMDGIEAITPIPQGDVTIEETKEALGDMIRVDGIPMTWFLPFESNESIERVTRKTIETFAPNLILGISDELSPVCDIEKVRLVAEIVKEYEQ